MLALLSGLSADLWGTLKLWSGYYKYYYTTSFTYADIIHLTLL